MKIFMHSLCAGPDGVLESGKSYEVRDDKANELIKAGAASPAGSTARAGVVNDAPKEELEQRADVPEKATAAKKGRKPKGK